MGIIEIIIFVFAVLQVILFFKLWGMTNNVKKLVNQSKTVKNEKYFLNEAVFYDLKGDKEKAKEMYENAYIYSIIKLFSENNKEFYEKFHYEIMKKYSNLIDIDFSKYEDYNKVKKIISNL